MKRAVGIVLAFLLTVSLAACGAKPVPPAASRPSSASSKAAAQQVNGQTKEKIRDYLRDIAHFLQGSMPPFDRIAQIDSTWVVNDTWLRVPSTELTSYRKGGTLYDAVSLASVEKAAKRLINPDLSLPPNTEYHLDTTMGPHPEWVPSQRLFIWAGSGLPAVGWDYPITSAVKDGDQYRVACAETYYIPSSDEMSVGPHGTVFCDGRQVGTEKDGADEKTPPSFHYTTDPAELRQIGFVLRDNGSGGFYVVSKTGAQSEAEFSEDSSQPAAADGAPTSGSGTKEPSGNGTSSSIRQASAGSGARGNTVGNIVNGGQVAKEGGWIYYSNYSNDSHKLCKIRTDGTGRTELSDDNSYDINVVDGWIYYCMFEDNKLYKMRTDGTGRTKLSDDKSDDVNVVGDWIYYSNYSGSSGNLYKMRTDGTGRTKLSDDEASDINVVDGWIYYSNGSNHSRPYRIRTNGTGRTKLSDDSADCINVVDGWIYYKNGGICKIRTDGTGRTKLDDTRSINGRINVADGWIYCTAETGLEHYFYKIRTDGTGRTILSDEEKSIPIYVTDGWIYYNYSNGTTDWKLYKMHTDGTAQQLFE